MSRVFKVDYIPDPDRGRPLWNAKIFVGVANQDPTIPSNQIQLTGDIGFPVGQSIPVPQPVRTNAGGITVYNNSPLDLNAPGQEYAIQIFDRNDNLIYNFPQVDGSVVMNTTSQEEVTGLTIWPEVGEAVIGQTIPAGTDAIRYPFNGRSTLFTIKPPVAVTGTITNITINSSGIGELEVDNSDVYDLAEFNLFIAANDGDSQLAGGNIWPLSSQDSAQVGDDLTGYYNVRLSGGDFAEITIFPMVKKDGTTTTLSGNLSNINLTIKPYSATVGTDDVWLLDIRAFYSPFSALSVASFWAAGDDSDESDQIQEAINYLSNKGGGDLFISSTQSRYRITKSINIPIGLNIRGDGPLTNIFVESGGTYTNNYAFLINTTDGTDEVVANANIRAGHYSSLTIDAGDNLIKCFAFSGSPTFEQIDTNFFAQSVFGTTRFNDQLTVKKCNFSSNVVSASYQVELENLGDGVVLDQLQIANVGNDPLTPQRSIRINGGKAKITNCLYGDVFLTNCSNSTTIENCGQDGGRTIIERSSVSIKDCGASCLPDGIYPITIDNNTSFTYKVSLENIVFSHDIFRGAFEVGDYDVQTDNDYVVSVKNVSRRIFNSNSPASSNQLGIRMVKGDSSPFDEFNKFSHYYSHNCTISDQKIVNGNIDIALPSASLNFFTNLALFPSDDWDIATGTYYYKINVYWDLDRAVSRTEVGGERSIALTNGGDAAVLEVSPGVYPPNMYIRIFRGTSAGVYDNYADIPIVGVISLIDNGNSISGTAWTARTPGAADAINAFNLRGYSNTMGNAEIRATAIPTTGSWQVNDKVIPQASAGGDIFYSCVVAGTPGTWKSGGTYEA